MRKLSDPAALDIGKGLLVLDPAGRMDLEEVLSKIPVSKCGDSPSEDRVDTGTDRAGFDVPP